MLSKSFASASSKQRRRSFINAAEKTFALYFIHETCVHKVFPVSRFFDLHEFEKNRSVFSTRVRNFGKNLQQKFITVSRCDFIKYCRVVIWLIGYWMPLPTKS